MDIAILSVLIILVGLQVLLLIQRFKKDDKTYLVDAMKRESEETRRSIELSSKMSSSSIFEGLQATNNQVLDTVREMSRNNEKRIAEMREELYKSVSDIRIDLKNSLKDVREDNTKQLEAMRSVVDEKLSKTLNERLSQSFEMISKNLELVINGLSDMKELSGGVTDLKKVLTGVKTRGSWGEVSLESLLDDILTPEQYERNSKLGRRVKDEQFFADFAIVLPGADNEKVYLPIDSKFPVEDYMKMNDAMAAGNAEETEFYRKRFISAVKLQAKSIKDKYINPPKTTDFAIMYLPVEGLYAEILRQSGLVEELQNNYRIVPAGPTNIAAMLNSLKMGFKTLAIQKSSGEIFKILAAFRTEFSKFRDIVYKVQSNIDSASKNLSDAMQKTGKIEQQLSKIEKLEIDTDLTPQLLE